MRPLIEWTADWRANWSAIDGFIQDWLGMAFQRRPDLRRVEELERAAGVRLPPSAREWCYFAWAAEQLRPWFSFRDCFVIERLRDHEAVSLLLQGESDMHWAVEERLLADEDPAVTAYALDYESSVPRFEFHGLWAPSVSAFAFDYLLTYLQSPGGGAGASKSESSFDRERLTAELGEPAAVGHLEVFAGQGILVFTSYYADNWHHETVHIKLQRKSPIRNLPPSVQRLLKDAYVLEGPLTTSR